VTISSLIILAESRAILERGRWEGRGMAAFTDGPPVEDDAGKTDPWDGVRSEPPVETRNQRDRREITEQETRFDAERAREAHRLDTRLLTAADVDQRIASALAAERQAVIPALRAAVDELLDQEREHAKRELTESMRSLELQIARLESALSALQPALTTERGKAIDLPNPLRTVN
jgi:hypothetical protein